MAVGVSIGFAFPVEVNGFNSAVSVGTTNTFKNAALAYNRNQDQGRVCRIDQ